VILRLAIGTIPVCDRQTDGQRKDRLSEPQHTPR